MKIDKAEIIRLADGMVEAMVMCKMCVEGSIQQTVWRKVHDNYRNTILILLGKYENERMEKLL